MGGDLSSALPDPHEAGPPRVASGAWHGFREVGRRAGWQPEPGAEAAGGGRHSEALPEWTQPTKATSASQQHNTAEPQ